MSPEIMRTELARAEEAELQSDEQVRELTALIDKAKTPNATISANDCHRLVSATLALNARLREQRVQLRNAMNSASRLAAETACEP